MYQNIYTVVQLARKQNKTQSRGCWNNLLLFIQFQKVYLFRSFGLAIVNKTKKLSSSIVEIFQSKSLCAQMSELKIS